MSLRGRVAEESLFMLNHPGPFLEKDCFSYFLVAKSRAKTTSDEKIQIKLSQIYANFRTRQFHFFR